MGAVGYSSLWYVVLRSKSRSTRGDGRLRGISTRLWFQRGHNSGHLFTTDNSNTLETSPPRSKRWTHLVALTWMPRVVMGGEAFIGGQEFFFLLRDNDDA